MVNLPCSNLHFCWRVIYRVALKGELSIVIARYSSRCIDVNTSIVLLHIQIIICRGTCEEKQWTTSLFVLFGLPAVWANPIYTVARDAQSISACCYCYSTAPPVARVTHYCCVVVFACGLLFPRVDVQAFRIIWRHSVIILLKIHSGSKCRRKHIN